MSDIRPTGFEVGVLNGNVCPGDVVAVVAVNSDAEDPLEVVRGLSDGLGADVAIEAVGVPETFELCTDLVRPGGRVANIGVHGHPATLHLNVDDVTPPLRGNVALWPRGQPPRLEHLEGAF